MTEPDKKLANTDELVVIPVIEERVKIETTVIETGRVQILKHVTEETETVIIPLVHEEHSIEHILINAFVDELPFVRQDGDVMIIPVLKEVMVKRILLVEEVSLGKEINERDETIRDTIRKIEVDVEEIDSSKHTTSATGMSGDL